jgi:hypothetical protein
MRLVRWIATPKQPFPDRCIARFAGFETEPARVNPLVYRPSPSGNPSLILFWPHQCLRAGTAWAGTAAEHLCSAKVVRYCWRLCSAATSLPAES